MSFTHLDHNNLPQMVSVKNKTISSRTAVASSRVFFPNEVWQYFSDGDIQGKKGPVSQTALIAGIQGAKLTSQLIPLCHPLPLDGIEFEFKWETHTQSVEILCTVSTEGKTGVEMEALTGASICALTFYDICKALSHNIQIGPTQLIKKTGGKSDVILSSTDSALTSQTREILP